VNELKNKSVIASVCTLMLTALMIEQIAEK